MIESMTRLAERLVPVVLIASLAVAATTGASDRVAIETSAHMPKDYSEQVRLDAGQTIEIAVQLVDPSSLPENGRVRVEWRLVSADNPGRTPKAPTTESPSRAVDAEEIYAPPTADWSKLLHALDTDTYVVYRAPLSGLYELRVTPQTNEVDLFSGERWREKGGAPELFPIPTQSAWPAEAESSIRVEVRDIELPSTQTAADAGARLVVETEPNDTPEMAQPIRLLSTGDDLTLNVVGTSDDIEYFDNGKVGQSGDDWFRIDFEGPRSRLLTMCLSIPDQQVAARIRAYRIPPAEVAKGNKHYVPGSLLALEEYKLGENPNEGVHQQDETHRTAINRTLEPGGVYFIRVEANAPTYDLELRLIDPAPYDDPHQAIRHAIYDHVSQVDAWLTNRPRGASVERRIRDSGNLLGTNCMSCHTQSGVWGPAIPFAQGYRPQNVQHWRHLQNTSYQSMRPTNELEDAAVNTSLKPLDIGDGPAGSRVTGHALTALERFTPPRKLHSLQSLRAANYVLLTADPGGVNAAGPGANVGQGVVFNYTGEILYSAWKRTGEPKYFHGLEDKVRKSLDMRIKFTDDLAHRVELFKRFFPTDYVDQAVKVAEQEGVAPEEIAKVRAEAEGLARRMERRVARDIDRLRAIQLEDGSWSFDPGRSKEDEWEVRDKQPDPSPTALALIALHATGVDRDDPAVSRGVKSLLAMQHPTGYWNAASKTGFVSTGYTLHALAYYYPVEPPQHTASDYVAKTGETLVETIRRMRDLSVTGSDELAPLMIEGAQHPSPLVRYWAMIGLGATRHADAPEVLAKGLADRTKVVREAAHWGLRQHLIDDRGWDVVLAAADSDDDITREAALRTLVMKVDSVMPEGRVDYQRLTNLFDRALNDDPHPGVRAWATRAAWQWWVWNPPVREAINTAWIRLLTREESNALVENAIRYQSHALFIVNGHNANASEDHQYRELQVLFARLRRQMEELREASPTTHRRLVDRLVGVAATYYGQAGGDGGPGQIGYPTRGSDRLFGEALVAQLDYAESLAQGDRRHLITQVALEGSANNTYEVLQERLVDYSLNGPEDLRQIAAASISDPRLVRLVAVAEQLEPMYRQLLRGAAEPPRRKDLSDPILDMIRRVSWVLPSTDEQREEILQYFLPSFAEWQRPEAIAALTDAVARDQLARQADAAWYLADGMGQAIEENPDLHFEQLAMAFPEKFENDASARFWMRSIPWILTYKRDIPDVQLAEGELAETDPYDAIRSRALRLFIGQLSPEALAANRALAVELANKSALRRNPEVLAAMAKLQSFEENERVLEDAQKVLLQEQGMFEQQLAEAIAQEGDSRLPKGPEGRPQITKEFVEDFVYFRDFVVPEMDNVLRGDDRSCFSCHGEPDRVPSLELHSPDEVGYLPIDKLLINYRILQQRVDLTDIESSKLLRKPLNIQTGQEDGHQGGRRYQPMDPGYQILKKWAENQAKLHAAPPVAQP